MTLYEIEKAQDTSITYQPRRIEDTFSTHTEHFYTSPFRNREEVEEDEYTHIYNEEDRKFNYNSYNASQKKMPWWAWMWSIMFFMVFFPTNLSVLLKHFNEPLDTIVLTISTGMTIVSIIPLITMILLRYIRS